MRFLANWQREHLVLAALGALQGLTYALIFESDTTQHPTALATLWVFVTVSVICVQYTWSATHWRRLLSLSLVPGGLFAVLTAWVWWQIPPSTVAFAGDDTRLLSWGLAASLALLVMLPFVQIGQRDGRLFFPYSALFHHSWNNVLIALVAGCFMGACWVVLGLWAALFRMIGIPFFADLFFSRFFMFISTMTFLGYGLAIGRENESIINTLRRIILTICHLLMPCLAAIALLFLGTLPFTGLQTLWDTKQASLLLLGLSGLTIVFINAVFQDGNEPRPYSTWLRRLVEAALLALPVWCVLAGMAITLRIQQYGLTPERFYVTLLVGIAGGYALGYSLAVLGSRQGWLSAIRAVNVPMAWVVIFLAFLSHTPVLDALRWSARSQFQRLASGRVDAAQFDYAFLRFKLGHAGAAALTRLEQLATHPQAALIQARLAVVRQANSYWDVATPQQAPLEAGDFVVLEERTTIPAELLASINQELPSYWRSVCKTPQGCVMVGLNLDDDAELEYLVFLAEQSSTTYTIGYGYDHAVTGPWHSIGTFGSRGGGIERQELLEMLRQQTIRPVVPQYRDVLIGNTTFEHNR